MPSWKEVLAVLTDDLAGGRMPSSLCGATAAGSAITILADTLHARMTQRVLGTPGRTRRRKALRGSLGLSRVIQPGRRLILPVSAAALSLALLLSAGPAPGARTERISRAPPRRPHSRSGLSHAAACDTPRPTASGPLAHGSATTRALRLERHPQTRATRHLPGTARHPTPQPNRAGPRTPPPTPSRHRHPEGSGILAE